MSFSWCTHPKRMEEKWNPFWLKLKFIIKQSSGISEMQVHASTQIHLSFPHTLRNTHAYFPHVYPSHCSVLLPVDGGLYRPQGEGLRAPKCCFSPHYCQGIHRWLMMDYISASAQGFFPVCVLQQLQALTALAATLTMASTAQGISRRTFSLLSPRVRWAAVSQEMHRGETRHVPLFKGCYGYIRGFFFFFLAADPNLVFICLSVSMEMHLLQFGLVPLREAVELGCDSPPHTNLQF